MKVSTRTKRAIGILGILSDSPNRMSAEEIHSKLVLYDQNSYTTKRVLDALQKAQIIKSTRGVNGGYALDEDLSRLKLSTVDRLFRIKAPNDKSDIGRVLRKRINGMFRKISIQSILNEIERKT